MTSIHPTACRQRNAQPIRSILHAGPTFAWLVSIVVALVVTSWPTPASAIPPFARAYGVPCSTCHSTVTRRNEFGDAFRKAGFHWPAPSELSDQNPDAPPLMFRGFAAEASQLPNSVPVGLVTTMSAAANFAAPVEQERLTLGSPGVNLVFGASLGRHISFFGTWSGQGPPNELYLHIARPFKHRPEFNLRIGLFEQSTTMFKANESIIGRYQLGSSALNGHAVSQSRIGAEINGVVGNRIFYATGIVRNSMTKSSADGYYHVSAKIGGMDFLGTEPEFDLDAEPSFADEVRLNIGHWGYFGRVSDDTGKPSAAIRRLGLDAQLQLAKLSIWAGSVLGLDRDLARGRSNFSLSWFAEASYAVATWISASYLFQFQDAESLATASMRHDIGIVAMVLENLRVRLRYSFTDDKTDNDRAELQLLLAF